MSTDQRQKRDPRKRMIQGATALFRERGIEETSFSDVLERSGAPRGSIYHHFPGGKAQLAEEATLYAGDFSAAGLEAALAEGDPIAAVTGFAEAYAAALSQSGFVAGCPIVAAALAGERSPGAAEGARQTFARWEELLAEAFRSQAVGPRRARSLATLVIASIEGAIVLARAERSSEPLERVAKELEGLLGEALGRSG